MARTPLRWHQLDHSAEPILEYVVGRSVTQTRGPIPEFLAKKHAEQAEKTYRQYKESVGQVWDFLEGQGLTTIGDFSVHAVCLENTGCVVRA